MVQGLPTTTGRMTRDGDHRTWKIDEELGRIQLDYQVRLLFVYGPQSPRTEAQIVIETTFAIIPPGAEESLVDPGVPTSMAPLLPLLHRRVDRVTAHSSGLLEIYFADGTVIRVSKRTDGFESWNTFGAGALHDFNMLCSSHDVAPWGDK